MYSGLFLIGPRNPSGKASRLPQVFPPSFERTSQPVQSPFGWHLIVVEERRVQDVSDDRKRAAARNALRERKSDEAYQDWLRQLRDRAYVEYRWEEQ